MLQDFSTGTGIRSLFNGPVTATDIVYSERKHMTCSFCSVAGDVTLVNRNFTSLHFPGWGPIDSCQSARSILGESNLTADSPDCRLFQSIGNLCGCLKADDSCTFCRDGSAVKYPEKSISFISTNVFGFVPTCEFEAGYLATIRDDSEECIYMQQSSYFCGCEALEDHCNACERPVTDSMLEKQVQPIDSPIEVISSCQLMEARSFGLPEWWYSDECFELYKRGQACGCNNGVGRAYGYPTWSRGQRETLTWAPILAGLLGLVLTTTVTTDIIRQGKWRTNMYHQIIFGMMMFDFITNFSGLAGPLPMPREIDGYPTGIFGAHGTETTCRVQAFFSSSDLARCSTT